MRYPHDRLRWRTVLVLAGSRSIGADIVRRFPPDDGTIAFSCFGSREAHGKLSAETGSEALQCNRADRVQWALVRDRPPLDILVMNAGGDPLALDTIARMIGVKVRSPCCSVIEANRRMGEGGRIVTIGSTNGDRVPCPAAPPTS